MKLKDLLEAITPKQLAQAIFQSKELANINSLPPEAQQYIKNLERTLLDAGASSKITPQQVKKNFTASGQKPTSAQKGVSEPSLGNVLQQTEPEDVTNMMPSQIPTQTPFKQKQSTAIDEPSHQSQPEIPYDFATGGGPKEPKPDQTPARKAITQRGLMTQPTVTPPDPAKPGIQTVYPRTATGTTSPSGYGAAQQYLRGVEPTYFQPDPRMANPNSDQPEPIQPGLQMDPNMGKQSRMPSLRSLFGKRK